MGVHCTLSSTFLYEKFPPKLEGKTRLGGKEMETINTDNFSEGLAAKEAKKWRIGGGNVRVVGKFLSLEKVQLTVIPREEKLSDPGGIGEFKDVGFTLTREVIILIISSKSKLLKQLLIVLHYLLSFFFCLKGNIF